MSYTYWLSGTGVGSIIQNNPGNTAAGSYSIVSGKGNIIGANCDYSSINGGKTNTISSSTTYGIINGGIFNLIGPDGTKNTIINGYTNRISSGSYNTIINGDNNVVEGSDCVIVEGNTNYAYRVNKGSMIGAGNSLIRTYNSHANGSNNKVEGPLNSTANQYNTIVNGYKNIISGETFQNTILNGTNNNISSSMTSVIGGSSNKINNSVASATFGDYNTVSYSNNCFVAGQLNEIQTSWNSAIVAGTNNKILGGGSVVNSIILGGEAIIATNSNTAYVDKLQVRSLTGATTQMVIASSSGLLGVQKVYTKYMEDDYITTASTYSDVTNMSFDMNAGEIYDISIKGLMSCNSLGGLGLKLNGPGGKWCMSFVSNVSGLANFRSATIELSGVPVGNIATTLVPTKLPWEFKGTISASTNGMFSLTMNSHSGGTATLKGGALLKATKIN